MSDAPGFSSQMAIERFLRASQGEPFQDGELLPFHLPECYGCGPENESGLHLSVRAAPENAVAGEYTFTRRLGGAPGVAHGGAVAALLDDLFGFVLVRILVPAVTRDLQVRYRRPVHLHTPCALSARLVGREGREVHMAGELRQEGQVKAAAEAVFVELEPERLLNRYERLEP
ncbi:MAG TPA: PaaI family thioesterase [Egibacteraceae bacterium]|nr:PaaI family thioesterase [Egibacteraceae bacterium]